MVMSTGDKSNSSKPSTRYETIFIHTEPSATGGTIKRWGIEPSPHGATAGAAVGAIAGTALGPAGIAVGTLIGGIIGGIFGPTKRKQE